MAGAGFTISTFIAFKGIFMTILKFFVEVLLLGLGFLGGFFYRKHVIDSHQKSLEALGKKILDEARKEAETIKKEAKLQAKDQLLQMKMDFEKETQERRHELNQQERRLLQKEEHLEKKAGLADERDNELIKKQKLVAKQEEDLKTQTERYQHLIDGSTPTVRPRKSSGWPSNAMPRTTWPNRPCPWWPCPMKR
jgi:hypothetical protein